MVKVSGFSLGSRSSGSCVHFCCLMVPRVLRDGVLRAWASERFRTSDASSRNFAAESCRPRSLLGIPTET